MSEATQNNDSIYIYLNLTENEKTLHIKSNQPYQESSKYFKTKSEHICSIRKLYEYLGSEEAKEAGIDRNKIIGDFTKCQSGIELNDKATFKVELEIDVWLKNKLLWGNITFMQKVVMTFHIENDVEMIYFKDNIFQDECRYAIWGNEKEYNIKFENNSFKKSLHYQTDTNANFKNSEFLENAIFDNPLSQNQTEYSKELKFENCIFGNPNNTQTNFSTNFKNCEFQNEVSFKNSKFINNVYFNNSHFKNYADFHECEFEKTASFYGATFEKAPNFSQAQFKGSLNLVNTNLDFDFKDVETKIREEYINTILKRFEKLAKEIKGTNLEVTNFLKKELQKIKEDYIKNEVLELISSLHKLEKELTNFNNEFKRAIKETEQETKCKDKFANDFRDSFRLFKSALIKDNNLLDASNFHKFELYCKEIELDSKKPKIFSKEWIDNIVLKFYRLTSDHHTDLFKNFHSLLLVIGIFGFLSGVVILGFAGFYGGMSSINLHILTKFYTLHIKHFILTHTWVYLLNFLLIIIFIILYACSIKYNKFRQVFIAISYLTTLTILITSPKYIIPAIGIFTDKQSILDPLSTIGATYTLLFALMIYSFIKTARKNSIIPS